MKIDNFEKEVYKLFSNITGLEINQINPKWWKIKTSVKSMIEKLYSYKTKDKFLHFHYDVNNKKFYINGDLTGIFKSTFRQYFIVGYILGVFKIDDDVVSSKTFMEFASKKAKFELTTYFLDSANYEIFLIEHDIIKRIKEVIMWSNPSSFIWKSLMNFIFTIVTYTITYKQNTIELMMLFLENYRQKASTKIAGAIEEYESQKELAIRILNSNVERK
ncbi:hypothetical protein EELLY_v1c02820 [Entomoplasma ellychniae]|uniref:Uncharacterized protein n=1 Tax=Entomoplasma ellychniae TaxID=2114 RepID=A0A8E2QVS7_9MOLU|nr:hypothetical protein [Entomoplasma ellychniae]PPE04602.1 hypothetical protein EELLY_v1c02820 [Entomoplasma ellychniae]